MKAVSLSSFNTLLTRSGKTVISAVAMMQLAAKGPRAGRMHRSTHERALALTGLAVEGGGLAVHDGSFQKCEG